MLSQQAAASQTDSTSSVADLTATSDQAKQQKPAAVPAGNQPKTASQPTSKAVQSRGVAAGIGVQPPLVELETMKATTAPDVGWNPGAVLPIT